MNFRSLNFHKMSEIETLLIVWSSKPKFISQFVFFTIFLQTSPLASGSFVPNMGTEMPVDKTSIGLNNPILKGRAGRFTAKED